MRITDPFANVVRERFKRLVSELPQSVASIRETNLAGFLSLRLEPKHVSLCPLLIEVYGVGCDIYIGSQGRFEGLKQDADLIVGFVQAALQGKVSETVWEWKGKELRVITKVEIDEILYTHDWSWLVGMLAELILKPWVKKQEIQYRPYSLLA